MFCTFPVLKETSCKRPMLDHLHVLLSVANVDSTKGIMALRPGILMAIYALLGTGPELAHSSETGDNSSYSPHFRISAPSRMPAEPFAPTSGHSGQQPPAHTFSGHRFTHSPPESSGSGANMLRGSASASSRSGRVAVAARWQRRINELKRKAMSRCSEFVVTVVTMLGVLTFWPGLLPNSLMKSPLRRQLIALQCIWLVMFADFLGQGRPRPSKFLQHGVSYFPHVAGQEFKLGEDAFGTRRVASDKTHSIAASYLTLKSKDSHF